MAICRLKADTLGGMIASGFSKTRPAEVCCSVVGVRRDLKLGALSFGELFAQGCQTVWVQCLLGFRPA